MCARAIGYLCKHCIRPHYCGVRTPDCWQDYRETCVFAFGARCHFGRTVSFCCVFIRAKPESRTPHKRSSAAQQHVFKAVRSPSSGADETVCLLALQKYKTNNAVLINRSHNGPNVLNSCAIEPSPESATGSDNGLAICTRSLREDRSLASNLSQFAIHISILIIRSSLVVAQLIIRNANTCICFTWIEPNAGPIARPIHGTIKHRRVCARVAGTV